MAGLDPATHFSVPPGESYWRADARRLGGRVKPGHGEWGGGYAFQFSSKSFQSGFVFSISAIFQARFQRLMLVSRWMAFA
jgi:hypothetical protein